MLLKKSLEHQSFGIRFKGAHQERVTGIHSLGWETQTSELYDWDGLSRKETGRIVFQYTLDGKGEIRVENQTYYLKPGDAFFVKIPSDHRYYLPSDSHEWEFIYLTLYGEEALRSFEEITNKVGPVIKLGLHDSPINLFFDLFKKVMNNELHDAFEASTYAYTFLMEVFRSIYNTNPAKSEWPEPVSKAVDFMQTYYTEPISLDDIVTASGKSKFHFTRLFHQTTNATPLQYVTKIRLNKAIELLKNQELTIEEVAIKVGYANGNYFSKVFRSYLGIAPGKFRNSKSVVPVDHLILDF
ncbi:helix-turn-helix domain-containing protein [Radiobacillus sp. PE A8.2]|uniref:AraC family transcriptional regulator n=1 Tax=Radiobacillus sp. PE A8.2 TaxID=3380349 RepID=UPI00388F8136